MFYFMYFSSLIPVLSQSTEDDFVVSLYRGSYMSAPLVADIEDLTSIHECSPCCRYRGSYMSVPLVADIEDLT